MSSDCPDRVRHDGLSRFDHPKALGRARKQYSEVDIVDEELLSERPDDGVTADNGIKEPEVITDSLSSQLLRAGNILSFG